MLGGLVNHRDEGVIVRYPNTRKNETREKLLASSRAIAKAGGFDTTGVDALMGSIGLTGGAFYGHFPSKQALFRAIVEEEMENSLAMLAGNADSPANHVEKCLRDYLSSFHAMNPDIGCVLPTLGAEIARAGPEVRRAVEASLKRIQKAWSERVGESDAAWALIAQCVGALVVARTVQDERTRKEILAASRRFLAASIGKTRPKDT
jgi:TetR/AcrR family transcriptional regulator, transcriptional repressor for nem operon